VAVFRILDHSSSTSDPRWSSTKTGLAIDPNALNGEVCGASWSRRLSNYESPDCPDQYAVTIARGPLPAYGAHNGLRGVRVLQTFVGCRAIAALHEGERPPTKGHSRKPPTPDIVACQCGDESNPNEAAASPNIYTLI
jgi:hypothetical protein